METILLILYLLGFAFQIILLVKSIKNKNNKYWIVTFVIEIIFITHKRHFSIIFCRRENRIMANLAAKNEEGKVFKVWSLNNNSSVDGNEEILFLIKNKGLCLDPDCSWRTISIISDGREVYGNQDAVLLYTICREKGKIVDGTLTIVSKEEFEKNYSYC